VTKILPTEITFLEGGLATDNRGSVSFVNEFPFTQFKRFYTIKNHAPGFVRAWHGHQHESKAYFITSGVVVVGAVKVDDWTNPSPDLPVHTQVMSAEKPGILFIPGGHANGFMSLTEDAQVLLFSNFSLEESLEDDIRFDPRFWNPWESFLATS
jgi:dTDP-4-dehydrorhamnose 3,5-epimerase-like enzyme